MIPTSAPLAQYAGYDAPLAGSSGLVRQARVALTQAEYENLNTVPKTIVPAIAGAVILPIMGWIQMQVTVAYGGSTTLALRYALGGPNVAAGGAPVLTAPATVGSNFVPTQAAFSSASPPFPTGSPLLLTGNAALGGGTLVSITMFLRYVVMFGGL